MARDAELSVRVVALRTPQLSGEAQAAAEQAGVDVVVTSRGASATVHFVARHQDRRLVLDSRALPSLSPIVLAAGPEPDRPAGRPEPEPRPAARSVDLVAFWRVSEALGLSRAADTEAELIWGRLLRARVRAHVCGGIPTLFVNDMGGLVALLRLRAQRRGVAVRVNPDVCACR